ncbi:MAG: hypothetical protein QNK05_18710 [Myxococcota bacterium]|nr:hypothetical protein [Myxococcota bacterium]
MLVNPRNRMLVAIVTATFALLFAAPGFAAKEKSVQNEAEFVSFDPGSNTVVVKILKKGKGNKKLIKKNASTVKKGKEVTFNVIPTGSVLKRTSVAINGVKGEMTDIQPGKQVLIYWVTDPNKEDELFARKIDVVLSDEEIDKRWNASVDE